MLTTTRMEEFYRNIVIVCFFSSLSFATALDDRCQNGALCIPVTECTGLYSAARRSVVSVEMLRKLHCGFDIKSNPKICCPPDFLTQYPTTTKRPYTISKEASLSKLLPDFRVCGIQNADRILGGTVTEIDEHPWMALLNYTKPSGSGFYCGGVLISKRYVLTAAHCVKGADLPKSWKLSAVRLGEWDLKEKNDCNNDDCSVPVQDIEIEEIIAHESYDSADTNQHNDIAILRLKKDVTVTDFSRPICLPFNDDLRSSSFEGDTMEVAGWGKTESRSTSDLKLKVRVPVIKASDCREVYNRVNRVIASSQLCAGGLEGQDSCRGDSGGPLMGEVKINHDKRWMVVGVVSYGPSPCGTKGWPGVYTRITSYIDWIISKMH